MSVEFSKLVLFLSLINNQYNNKGIYFVYNQYSENKDQYHKLMISELNMLRCNTMYVFTYYMIIH